MLPLHIELLDDDVVIGAVVTLNNNKTVHLEVGVSGRATKVRYRMLGATDTVDIEPVELRRGQWVDIIVPSTGFVDINIEDLIA